jgi:hypothetical protein
MLLDQALAIVKAAGFRVTNPKPPKVARPALNAVGKPYSPQYDPKYRIKHKPRTGHLFFPYSRCMRFVGEPAPKVRRRGLCAQPSGKGSARRQTPLPGYVRRTSSINPQCEPWRNVSVA